MRQDSPQPVLSVWDAVALIVGIVVGAGIFKTPALVAANAGGESFILLTWLLGGAISLVGALCYAELATAHPHPGGEYHFLFRAYGRGTGFLFAWTRLMVMQTGSIALLAFVFGDYFQQILPLAGGSPVYAALAVAVFTGLNVAGLRSSFSAQRLLAVATVVGVLALAMAGLLLGAKPVALGQALVAPSADGLGMAMVFVLLTFGGWNEAAYVSAELRDGPRNMVRALLVSITTITVLYLLVNLAYLRVLGHLSLQSAEAPGSALMYALFGPTGAALVSALVAVVALASLNVTILTGARSSFALARDFRLFRWLDYWHAGTGTPLTALLAQGAIALLLVLLGALTRNGFETMVEYISPVFWLFFLLTGLSLFVLRRREPEAPRPFRVPGYPLTPLLFCASCALLLYSSISYTGVGALVGVAVLSAGVPLMLLASAVEKRHSDSQP
ncbi:MAG TPA: amino acid permease [Gammaproteobacteria bacterium]|nr:amino acid permease [Gammaproteobacteria bacterium]